MNKKGRISIRNKFVRFINEHHEFGAKVSSGPVPAPKKRVTSKERHFWRLISGTAKDGRTILIYPLLLRNERVPIFVCQYLAEIADKTPYVGLAETIGDVLCILKNDQLNYPRADRTFYFRYWLKKNQENRKNGSSIPEDPGP